MSDSDLITFSPRGESDFEEELQDEVVETTVEKLESKPKRLGKTCNNCQWFN